MSEKRCEHIAIILDGNGRWAKAQGKPRTYGHAVGADNVEKITLAADALGVKYLTLYAFSTENWKRPKLEVNAIMNIIADYIEKCKKLSVENNVRVLFIGDRDGLSNKLLKKMDELMELSALFTGLTLIIAVNYGSRDEIMRAFNKYLESTGDNNKKLTAETFESFLDTKGIPDPDLLIRTGGEKRLSNYLLWQLCYTELFFTDVPWPSFSKEDLKAAIEEFNERNRRYGGI